MEVAKEVCGTREKSVENPWMVGKEEEAEELRRVINAAVLRRNEVVEGERRGERTADEVEAGRDEVRRARWEWDRVTRSWGR